ncbi:MAG TPA: hypothetical protein VF306_00715, partial [Pirellulales bacterium]
WAMGNGQWAMGNGQWAMGNGQWAMGGTRFARPALITMFAPPSRRQNYAWRLAPVTKGKSPLPRGEFRAARWRPDKRSRGRH